MNKKISKFLSKFFNKKKGEASIFIKELRNGGYNCRHYWIPMVEKIEKNE